MKNNNELGKVFSNYKFIELDEIQECNFDVPTNVISPIGVIKTNRISFTKGAEIYNYSLTAPMIIDSYIGKILIYNSISFYKSGKIKSCVLVSPIEISVSVNCLQVSQIEFYESGKINSCGLIPSQAVITSMGIIKFCKIVSFYENGNVKTCFFSKTQHLISSIGPLKISRVIDFYENGQIKCSAITKQNIETPAGVLNIKIIFFHKSEKIDSCVLTVPQEIKTPIGHLNIIGVGFYESGTIKNCSFNYGSSQDINTPAGFLKVHNISFYENGKIELCGLDNNLPQDINTPCGILKVITISFYKNGKIKMCYPINDLIINDINYKWKNIGWDEDRNFIGEFIYNFEINDYILKNDKT